MFNLAARTEGKNPPSKPITRVNISEEIAIEGESENEKANSENEFQLRVDIVKN